MVTKRGGKLLSGAADLLSCGGFCDASPGGKLPRALSAKLPLEPSAAYGHVVESTTEVYRDVPVRVVADLGYVQFALPSTHGRFVLGDVQHVMADDHRGERGESVPTILEPRYRL